MKIYLYNMHYKNEFIAEIEKDVKADYQFRAPETPIAPPQKEQGKCWCFNQTIGQWDHVIEDFRGTVIYNVKDSRLVDKVKFVGKIKDGWTDIEPPDHVKKYMYDGGQWVQIIEPKIFTKLSIRRACRALTLEDKLNQLLNSNPLFSADWHDAQEIDLNDHITRQGLLAGTFSESEINKIIEVLENE